MRSCLYPKCKSFNVHKAGLSRPRDCLAGRRRQIYRCRDCGRRFSENSDQLTFRLRKKDGALNAKIFYFSNENLSNRAIAKLFYLSEHCVRIRIARLARQALAFQSRQTRDFKISEPICFDGLRNFAGSQYDPNDINQAIGRDSLFIHDFNFASFNRTGRMSPWQKNRMKELETKHGRYPANSIRIASRDAIERLHHRSRERLELISDEHFQYRKVVNEDLSHLRITHATISSKACRNFQNILFSVNHADLMIRQQVKAFARETISFSKTPGAMCQKYALYMVRKNFMAPQFTKKHIRRPFAHNQSPAQHLGICNRKLEFADVFYKRSTEEDLECMSEDWRCFWRGEVPKKYRRSNLRASQPQTNLG